MTMKLKYEKPGMKRVELRSARSIADECWANAASGKGEKTVYWYELDNKSWGGQGTYVGFSVIDGGSCKDAAKVEYRIYQYGPNITTEAQKEEAAAMLNAAFVKDFGTGDKGNGGSPFKGTTFSSTIGQSW